MELIQILTEIILSVSIFSGMGSASQSGKLLFRQIFSGNNVSITDGPIIMTLSNTFTQSSISQSRVVVGTGNNITASNILMFGYNKAYSPQKQAYFNKSFLTGISVIQNYSTPNSPVFNVFSASVYGKRHNIAMRTDLPIYYGFWSDFTPASQNCSPTLSGLIFSPVSDIQPNDLLYSTTGSVLTNTYVTYTTLGDTFTLNINSSGVIVGFANCDGGPTPPNFSSNQYSITNNTSSPITVNNLVSPYTGVTLPEFNLQPYTILIVDSRFLPVAPGGTVTLGTITPTPSKFKGQLYNPMMISGYNNFSLGFFDYNLVNSKLFDRYQLWLGGAKNVIINAYQSAIIGGFTNSISAFRISPSVVQETRNSMIVGGSGNRHIATNTSVILSGKNNIFFGSTFSGNRTSYSTIVSGSGNRVSGTQSDLVKGNESISQISIISSKESCFNNSVFNSSFISNDRVCLLTNFSSNCCFDSNTILTSANSGISNFKNYTHCTKVNNLISTPNSIIFGNIYSTIISGNSNCLSANLVSGTGGTDRFNSIVASRFSCLYTERKQGTDSVKYNSLISSYFSKIQTINLNDKTLGPICFNTIIGGMSHSFDRTLFNTPLFGCSNYVSWIGGRCNLLKFRGDGTTFIAGICSYSDCGYGGGGTIIGGYRNKTIGTNSTAISGRRNRSYAYSSVIGGCYNASVKRGLVISSYLSYSNDGTPIITTKNSCATSNKSSAIVSGCYNRIYDSVNSSIIGGRYNNFTGVPGSNTLCNLFIIGGSENTFKFCTSNCTCRTYDSGIIGGCKNSLFVPTPGSSICGTVILGACGLSSSEGSTTVVKNLWITGTLSTGSPLHFNPNFTYSHDGLTGNFSNVNDIIFVNGLVVGVTTDPIVYNAGLVFKITASSTSFDLTGVSSSVVLVNWGDLSSTTYSRSPSNTVNASHTYGSIGDYIIKVHGTFSGFTASGNQVTELTEFSQLTRIKVNSSQLNTVDNTEFTSQTAWTLVDFNDSRLNLTSVNNILVALDAQATVPTYVGLSQSPARIPTGGGSVSRANLIADGAVVITNWF
jgi:hypothetical protein